MKSGWVYAAASTILVVVPVQASSIPRVRNDVSTAFVTLSIPKNVGEAEPLTLRLDIGKSNVPCGHGDLTINGQKLAQDDNGNGQGTLAAHQNGNFTANWAFSCTPNSLGMLKMQVTELDGLEIAPFNFSTTFTQTNPRQITIDNAAVVNHVHKLPHETSKSTQTSLQDRLHAKIHDLDVLRIKARQLENAIISQENKIAELLGQKKSLSIQDCDNLECVLEGLGEKFRDAAEKLGGDVEELKEFIAHSRDESLPVPPEDYEYWFDDEADDKAEEYDLKKHAGKWTWADQMPLNGEAVDAKITTHPRQPPLVMAIALSVIGLCLLSTIFMLRLHRKTTPRAIDNEKVLFSERPPRPKRESWGERCARRQARRQAIKEYVANIFTRWRTQPAAPALECSIEEEFASFREAVSVVDSLVAAEEGRNREVPRYTPCEYGHFRDDESLPPYESEDESPVADGLRYGGGGDDRLGYGK